MPKTFRPAALETIDEIIEGNPDFLCPDCGAAVAEDGALYLRKSILVYPDYQPSNNGADWEQRKRLIPRCDTCGIKDYGSYGRRDSALQLDLDPDDERFGESVSAETQSSGDVWLELAEEEAGQEMESSTRHDLTSRVVLAGLRNNMRSGYTMTPALEARIQKQEHEARAARDKASARLHRAQQNSAHLTTLQHLQAALDASSAALECVKATANRFEIIRRQTATLHKRVASDRAYDTRVFTEYHNILATQRPLMGPGFEACWLSLLDKESARQANPVYRSLCNLEAAFGGLLDGYFTVRAEYGIHAGVRRDMGQRPERDGAEHSSLREWRAQARNFAGLFTLFAVELLFHCEYFGSRCLDVVGGLNQVPPKAKALWRDLEKAEAAMAAFEKELGLARGERPGGLVSAQGEGL